MLSHKVIMYIDNFMTNRSNFSVAIDDNWDLTDDLIFMTEAYDKAYQFVQTQNNLTLFYKYFLRFGKQSGFQMYISSHSDMDSFITKSLDQSPSKTMPDTYFTKPYSPKRVKNLTFKSLRTLLNSEYRYLHRELIKFANQIGMGFVDSNGMVNYITNLRKLSAGRQNPSACIPNHA